MKDKFNSLLLILIIAGCTQQPKNGSRKTDASSLNKMRLATEEGSAIEVVDSCCNVKQPLPAAKIMPDKEKIIGVWTDKTSPEGNSSVAINKETFFSPETANYYLYKLIGGKIQVKYDDGITIYNYKFKGNDTLILKDDIMGTVVYYRVSAATGD